MRALTYATIIETYPLHPPPYKVAMRRSQRSYSLCYTDSKPLAPSVKSSTFQVPRVDSKSP